MSSCLFFMHFKSKYYISLHVIFMPLQSTLSRLVSDSPLETYCRKPTASKSRTLKKHSEVEIKTFKRYFEITGSIKTALDFQEKQTSLTLASFFPSQTHWRSFCSFYFCSLTSLTAVDLTIHSGFFLFFLSDYFINTAGSTLQIEWYHFQYLLFSEVKVCWFNKKVFLFSALHNEAGDHMPVRIWETLVSCRDLIRRRRRVLHRSTSAQCVNRCAGSSRQ